MCVVQRLNNLTCGYLYPDDSEKPASKKSFRWYFDFEGVTKLLFSPLKSNQCPGS